MKTREKREMRIITSRTHACGAKSAHPSHPIPTLQTDPGMIVARDHLRGWLVLFRQPLLVVDVPFTPSGRVLTKHRRSLVRVLCVRWEWAR